MKIAFIITNRASFGRMKSVIREALVNHDVQITVAGAALHLDIGFPVKHRVYSLVDGDSLESMAKTASVLLGDIVTIFSNDKPDVVYIHGDRYEMLAVAIAASYMNIAIAHGEGGEDTGTIDNKVRYAISALADIHFPVSVYAKVRLEKMGYTNVHRVGSTALDNLVRLDLSSDRKEPYIVVLHHPNTTDPEPIEPLIEALKEIDIHKVWVNPNVDAGSKSMLRMIHRQDVEFVKDLPPEEYARLLKNCKCAVGNSSSFIKEGAFFGTPAILIGDRQHNREHAENVKHCYYDVRKIVDLITSQLQAKYEPDYRFGNGHSAEKIMEVLSAWTPS